jgi:hypothetical protein
VRVISVSCSAETGGLKKKAEKVLKYNDLTIEIQRMWSVKTRLMPVIYTSKNKDHPITSHQGSRGGVEL